MRIATIILAGTIAALAPLAPLCAQGKPKRDPLDKQLAALKEALADRRGKQDAEALRILGDLKGRVDKGIKDADAKNKVRSAVGRVFQVRPVRPHDNPRLYRSAASILAGFGPEGAQIMRAAYGDKKRFPANERWAPLRSALLLEIGKTKDPKQIDFLLDTATRSPLNQLQGAAGRALAHFEKAKGAVRMLIAKRLIRRFGEIHSKATQIAINRPGEPQDLSVTNAEVTLRAIAPAWNRTLAKVTRATFDTPPKWSRWWTKVGKKRGYWKD